MPKWFEIAFGVLVAGLIAAGAVYINRPLKQNDLAVRDDLSTVPGIAEKTLPAQGESSQGRSATTLDFGDGEAPPGFEQFNQPQMKSSQPNNNQIQIPLIHETVRVTIKTSKGNIEAELFGEVAPLTVGNFVTLANSDFYTGTAFHRVIPDFMIQGGDPLSKDDSARASWGTGGPNYKFQDEINDRKLVRGSVAMANSGPNTNGSQFFVVTAVATPHLDGLHTNFGRVTAGMDVVEAIQDAERDENDNPLENIAIEEIVVHE